MSEINPQILQDGQLAIRTVVQNGDIVSGVSATDTTALVQTADGKQLCVKAVLVGISGDAGLIRVVNALPETGEPGYFYGVLMPEVDREGRGIIQFFIWYNNEWLASGAYSINIDPDTLIYKTDKNVANGVAGLNASAQLSSSVIPYATANDVGGIKQSFDSSTGTWTVTTVS